MKIYKGPIGRQYAMAMALAIVGVAAAAVMLLSRSFSRHPSGTDISAWPMPARATAALMMAEYGEPDQTSPQALVWLRAAPWAEIDAYRSGELRESIRYRVTPAMAARLKDFEPAIGVDAANGELSAQSDSESQNFLAINLAHEIVTGRRTVEDARAFSLRTRGLAEAGKSSIYLERLVFDRPLADVLP